jgi:hypothetical protein
MQSVNEELRCTNEELETSKEELQSVNEELATVNAELLTKVADLSRANNDMNNLLAGTGIATIFVDHELRILRFTPSATQIINLISNDVGRPVGHLVSNLEGYEGLVSDVQGVLDTLIPKELEVQTKGGQWYMLRILPVPDPGQYHRGGRDHAGGHYRAAAGAGGAEGKRVTAAAGDRGGRRERRHHRARYGGGDSWPGIRARSGCTGGARARR